jgi:hypothetical protein
MAERPAREFESKSDAIRQYLRDHPDARPSEVVAALKAQGIVISSSLAAKFKRARLGQKLRNDRPGKSVGRAPAKAPTGDKTDAIRAAIAAQGQRFRPRDVIAALAAERVDVSLAEVIEVAQLLSMRPRKRS